jgi:hypothetical protein
MKKTKAATKTAKTPKAPPAVHPMESMEYWRDQVKGLLPDERDDWKIGSLATWLKLQAGVLIDSWPDVKRFADDNEGIALSFAVKIDQSKTPPVVKLAMAYSEPHKWNAESEVPSSDQAELPGITAEAPVEDEPEHVSGWQNSQP